MITATQSAHEKERGPHPGKSEHHGLSRFLDAEKRGAAACQSAHATWEKIVGQDEAVQALVDLHQVFGGCLHSPGRRAGNLLFLGPTGSWKTRSVEAAAEIPFEDSRRLRAFARFLRRLITLCIESTDTRWRPLVGVLDRATLTLGDARSVDLSQTGIFLTSNWEAARSQM